MTAPQPARPPRRLTDRHAGERVETIRAVVTLGPWLLVLLVIIELLLWSRGVISGGGFTTLMVFVNPLALVGLGWLLRRASSHFAEGLMGVLLSSRGTPHTPEHSRVDALIIRGKYDEAIEELRNHLVAKPRDTAALIRLARVMSDHQQDLHAAVNQLHHARETGPTPAQETEISNALIDLHRALSDGPALRAELARFARVHHGTAAGQVAREKLREL